MEDAEKVARCIANSLLVKTSWYGSDPNWGRIIDAAGYAKVGMDFDKVDLAYNEVPALKRRTYGWEQVTMERGGLSQAVHDQA